MKIPESLCKDNILRYITERAIFERYLGHSVEIKEMYLSPLREESTPSFNIYENRYNGRLWFNDYGGISGDCFKLVEELYGETFMDALARINQDFNLGLGSAFSTVPNIAEYTRQPLTKKEFEIEVKLQDYTYQDKEYWAQYYLDLKYLKYFRVFSIGAIWVNRGRIHSWDYTRNNPVYGYLLKGRWKLYRPLEGDKYEKWKSNLPYNYWLGLAQLPKEGAKKLIISKGYKDVMVLRKLGLYAVAVSGEASSFPPALFAWLKERFEEIYIWYDNDDIGIELAEKRALEHNISYVHNPIGEPKDTSDFVKEYGVEAGKDLLYELNILQ